MKTVLKYFLPVTLLILITGCAEQKDEAIDEPTADQKEWAIAIHGGAGSMEELSMPDSVIALYKQNLNEALSIGVEILKSGGEAVDACEQVLRYFENNPRFNAGKGSVFTHSNRHEMDAAIMIGNTRQAGAVTGVTTVKHPITLARKVMEESKHVFFAAEGAEAFADKMNVERVPNDYFHTEEQLEQWLHRHERMHDNARQQSVVIPLKKEGDWQLELGTTGCVVLDEDGTLVAGTTTGGMSDKMFGRVGDVPIIGAGTYASEIVAVSMTGWGEKIMKAVSGHTVHAYMKFNEDATLREAGMYLLTEVLEPDQAGMIAVDRHGHTFMATNTEGMFRAMANSEGARKVAIFPSVDD